VYRHHEESICNVIEYFKKEPGVEALLLGGSLAHGFETATSDIDLMIIVSDQDYAQRLSQGHIHFYNQELCTYADGYVDGKYYGASYLQQVAEKGSEPARFAFQDARVLISQNEGIEEHLRQITRYPIEGKAEREQHFYAQFEAWNWYANEALRLENDYLLGVSVGKLVLFGGRLLLVHNEVLYPYHKWFLRVLAEVKEKPQELLQTIEALYQETSADNVRQFYDRVKGYREWAEPETGWPAQFMLDSELNWQTGALPIDDW